MPGPSLVIRRAVGQRGTYQYTQVHRQTGNPPQWSVHQTTSGAALGMALIVDSWRELLHMVLTTRPIEYHFCTDFNHQTGGGHWTQVVYQAQPGAQIRDRFQRGTANQFRMALEAQVNAVHRHHLPIGTPWI